MRALQYSHVCQRHIRRVNRLCADRHRTRLSKRHIIGTICYSRYRLPAKVAGSVHCARTERAISEMSDVMGRLKPSRTVALADLAKTMNAEGKDVINMAVGEPDFPTPEPVVQGAIDALQEGFTKYTENIGILPLRKAICQKLKSPSTPTASSSHDPPFGSSQGRTHWTIQKTVL